MIVVAGYQLPDPPKRCAGILGNSVLKGRRPAFLRNPGEVGIDMNDKRFRVEIDCGDLQPGRRVWSDVFYIGKRASGDLSLCGLVFADNLPQPKEFVLTVSVTVTKTAMTVDELCSLPGLAGRDEYGCE